MKRLLSLFLFLMTAMLSFAHDFVSGGIYYNITSSTAPYTVAVTYQGTSYSEYMDEYTGSVTIPEKVTYNGKTYSVTSIGSNAFWYCSGLTSVTIPNSVTSIGSWAFYVCSGMTAVTIPNSVTAIGDYAFYGCRGLTSIVVEKGNTKYDSRNNCNAIIETASNTLIRGCKTTVIPNSVTSIGDYAFYKCSGLTSVTIPNSVTSIGDHAFGGCDGLTSIDIPNSVTSIGNCAFEGCDGLTSIDIPNSVTSIGDHAFYSCSGLTSIEIPSSVTTIGDDAFYGCSGLTSVTIPNSVTKIGDEAFYNCSSLTSVIIPNSVTSIGSSAFSDCSGLTSVTIGNSVTSIGSDAFYKCSSLTSVTIGNSVTSIGGSAFYKCSGLTSIIIPNSVTSIGSYAFAYCSGLTSVTIPNSVTSIGSDAFYGCSGLTSVSIGNGVTSIGESAFEGCSGLTSVTIGNSVTTIALRAFAVCSGLTSVTIPNSVTTINGGAFVDCSGLTSITIPNSVTSIGSFAFYNCSSLTSVIIPNSVTSIGRDAFKGTAWYNNQPEGLIYLGKVAYKYKGTMPANTVIVLEEGTTGIAGEAFHNCSGLTSVTVPNSVTSIGANAFYGTAWYNNQPKGLIYLGKVAYKYKGTMPKNTVIDLEEGTTEIAGGAFYNCSGLIFITIPNSVTSIGEHAFYECSGLTSIEIPNSVTTIGEYAFYGCRSLTSVTLPDDLVSISNNTFPDRSTMKLYVNIGSKTLLALWKGGYSYVFEIGTQNRLQPSSTLYLSSSTQTSVTFNIDSKYSGYTFTCDGNNIGSGGITKTGLYPGQSQSFYITVFKDGLYHSFSRSFSTKGIAPVVSSIVSASSIKATGSYSTGDAKIVKHELSCNGKKVDGKNTSFCGLKPNTSYNVIYTITVAYGKNDEFTTTYTKESTIKTSELKMTTEQPKVVSVGNVIVSATTNVDEKEEDIGFEWRRTDWTNDFKSNTGVAYLYEGTMEGYIRNLYTGALWMVRPYYMASDGTYYYGDWMGIDPVNTSYFEPTVHTYANINIEGNTALVKGYALGGTDKITVQGFKYWKAANLAPSGDLALEARKASPAIPADAQTIEAEGRVMEATLSDLDYECTYSYVAFAKTDEGTFYGEVKTFTTGPNTTGIEVVRDADSGTKAVDDKVKGIYTLTGVKLSDDAADLKTLKRGIYIVNGRKVAVK